MLSYPKSLWKKRGFEVFQSKIILSETKILSKHIYLYKKVFFFENWQSEKKISKWALLFKNLTHLMDLSGKKLFPWKKDLILEKKIK